MEREGRAISAAGFPTFEAERQLQASRAGGVEPVALHGTPPRGLVALRETLAPELRRTTGRSVDPATEMLVTNGAMHALGICMRSLLRPGDEVVVPAPCFFFEGPIRAAGAVPVYVQGSPADGWRWDDRAVESAVGPRARALLLCNPGNPTGHLPTREEVAAVVAVAEAHGLLVITDEAYEASPWGDATLASAFGLADDAIVIRSLGKSLSLPQLRIGIVTGPAARIDPCAVHAHSGGDVASGLTAVGLPVVDGVHFQAPGYARLPFAGATRAENALTAALARWSSAGG